MLSDPDKPFDEELIELHLGRLAPARRDALLARAAADPVLARQHEQLSAAFAALGSLAEEPAPPDGLIERTIRRVRSAGATPRIVRPRSAAAPVFSTPRLASLRDVIAVAATVVLLVGLGVPALMRVRERERRIGCSANLARLGQGLGMYGTTYANSLPFAGWGADRTWQPTADARVQRLPNRAHPYRMLAAGTVPDPAWFVCPSRDDVPMARELVRRYSSFADARNVSYGYQNMAGVRPTLRDDANLPIMADDNPLFDDGLWIGLGAGPGANSRAHGGAGQNVLTLGGRVRWTTTPDCGVGGDNIWTLRDVQAYSGREGPAAATDSHLLK